jgi:hypothetical protein
VVIAKVSLITAIIAGARRTLLGEQTPGVALLFAKAVLLISFNVVHEESGRVNVCSIMPAKKSCWLHIRRIAVVDCMDIPSREDKIEDYFGVRYADFQEAQEALAPVYDSGLNL